MAIFRTILMIVFIIVSIILTVIILMQEGKNNGLGALPELQIPIGEKIKDVPWKVFL